MNSEIGIAGQIISAVVYGIEMVSAAMIAGAVVLALLELIRAALTGKLRETVTRARLRLGQRLVLGLEFMIAGDILKTVQAPTLEEIGLLGGVILIRTVLSLSIAYELKQAKHEENPDLPTAKSE